MRGDKYFKIIPCVSSLCPPTSPSLLFPLSRRWKSRKEDDSLPRESHDNNAGGKVPEKTTKSRRARGRNGEGNGLRGRAERTKRSREPKYIRKFKSSIRNNGLRATTTTTTCKRRYGGRGGGGPEKRARRRRRRRWTEKERGRAFSRGLSVDPDER